MTAKEVKFGNDARQAMIEGANLLAEAVKSLVAGMNPMDIKRDIDKTCERIVAILLGMLESLMISLTGYSISRQMSPNSLLAVSCLSTEDTLLSRRSALPLIT